jgi:hypothetical protein
MEMRASSFIHICNELALFDPSTNHIDSSTILPQLDLYLVLRLGLDLPRLLGLRGGRRFVGLCLLALSFLARHVLFLFSISLRLRHIVEVPLSTGDVREATELPLRVEGRHCSLKESHGFVAFLLAGSRALSDRSQTLQLVPGGHT